MPKMTAAQANKAFVLNEFHGVSKTALCVRYGVSQPTLDKVIREERIRIMSLGKK